MVDQTLYRSVLGQFATGVVVVTAADGDGGLTGLTVNAFSAVSLDPPLIMVCPQKTSVSCQHIVKHKKFAVHILTASQAETAWAFAKRDVDIGDIAWHMSDSGIPVLNDCLALIECRLWEIYEGGDHHILVGEVIHMESSSAEQQPLMFHRGTMSSLPHLEAI
ncbi:flavin reductase family protein [Dasania marina]|uniref:flavin reductase family protein n=1 Tax=Dasania marina TaxID=471499 RepID=UPI000477CFC5|nr:flavin reductase family protein [Dasania marina]